MFRLVADYLRSAGWTNWDVLQLPGKAVVWWIFEPERETPAMVGKFCQDPAAVEDGRRECDALRFLAPLAGRLGLPSPLFQAETRGGFVYLQSGMPGKPLRNEFSPSALKLLAEQMQIAESWLEKFQTLTPPAKDPGEAFRRVLAVASAGVPERLPEPLLRAASAALPLLSAVPAAAVHGDFWAKNVLVSPGRVCVVDWDAFHYGSPLEDLCTFAGALVGQWRMDTGRIADIIWETFFGSEPFTALIQAAAFRTLTRWNIPRGLLGPLFLFSLVSQLGRTDSPGHAPWRAFAARYAGAGCPAPLAGLA